MSTEAEQPTKSSVEEAIRWGAGSRIVEQIHLSCPAEALRCLVV